MNIEIQIMIGTKYCDILSAYFWISVFEDYASEINLTIDCIDEFSTN